MSGRRLPPALDAVGRWFVEPAEGRTLEAAAPGVGARDGGAWDTGAPGTSGPSARHPVIAVFGLGRRCGVTVVARALAAALAARDPAGAAALATDVAPRGAPLASRRAAGLASVLADLPGASTRAVGRLCVVAGAEPVALADTAPYHAPLVLDTGTAATGGVPASIADCVLLVATPALEPALARVVAAGVARVGPEPLVVLNRVRSAHDRWTSVAPHALPESRIAARVALAGYEPPGAFGRALRALIEAERLVSSRH